VVLTVSFVLLAGLGWLVTEQLSEIMVQVPSDKENIHHEIESIRKRGSSGIGKAVNDLSKELSAASEEAVNKKSVQTSGTGPIASCQGSTHRSCKGHARPGSEATGELRLRFSPAAICPGQAVPLCKLLRERYPAIKIVLGLSAILVAWQKPSSERERIART
jgi:hypothetical protein